MKGLQKNLILYHTPVQTHTGDYIPENCQNNYNKAITNVSK